MAGLATAWFTGRQADRRQARELEHKSRLERSNRLLDRRLELYAEVVAHAGVVQNAIVHRNCPPESDHHQDDAGGSGRTRDEQAEDGLAALQALQARIDVVAGNAVVMRLATFVAAAVFSKRGGRKTAMVCIRSAQELKQAIRDEVGAPEGQEIPDDQGTANELLESIGMPKLEHIGKPRKTFLI